MGTDIRAEVSKNNKYWISRHKYYELKHFCLQYPEWKERYRELSDFDTGCLTFSVRDKNSRHGDPTAERAVLLAEYSKKIELIEETAMDADRDLYRYILKAVTEGLSFVQLKHMYEIPCSRDMFYERYRRFFWILNRRRK